MADLINPSSYDITLGSQSPRRRFLLEQLGYQFSQISINADESYPDNIPKVGVAEYLAIKKANEYRDKLKNNELLITADTTVCLENKLLEKASNASMAKQMLQQLSGNSHEVISGVCLSSVDKQESFSVSTKVYFKELTEAEIDYYIEHYQPFDKAGAYGIQEWIGQIGVNRIEGSFYNVMGLPVQELYQAILEF